MDRFQATAEVLDGFRTGRLDPAVPEPWLEPLERAGVHPASLLLCASAGDLPRLEPVKAALARVGPPFHLVPVITYDAVAWSPLTYAHEIEAWTLAARGPGQRLPDHLLSVRGLTVQGNGHVRALGRGWAVLGRLRLEDLPRLHTLCGPLDVYGDLELDGLPDLRNLGPGIQVHGNLTVAGCPRLRTLGPGLRVAGAVWMDALPAGFQAGQAWLRRLQTPWPGIAPRPVPLPGLPPGALRLVGGQAPGPGEPGIPVT